MPPCEHAEFTFTAHEQRLVNAYEHWENSVVKISVLDQGHRKVVSSGCGILWNSDYNCNYVLTNAHVVLHARYIFRASGGEELRLVGIDSYHDIAVLAFDTDTDNTSITTITAVSRNPAEGRTWRGADAPCVVGQSVLCVYYPYDFPISLTVGVVSGTDREIKLRGAGKPPLYDVIQFDAAILPGASGSPLVNTSGHLVGMTVAMAANKGIGLAIPYSVLENVSQHIIKFQKPPPIAYIPMADGAHCVRMIDGWKMRSADDVWRLLHRKYKVGDTVAVEIDLDINSDTGGGGGTEKRVIITLEDRAASGIDLDNGNDDLDVGMRRAKL